MSVPGPTMTVNRSPDTTRRARSARSGFTSHAVGRAPRRAAKDNDSTRTASAPNSGGVGSGPVDLATRHGRSRSLWLLASAVIVGTLLASGCSGGGSVSAGNAQPASSAAAAPAASSKAVSAAQKGCGTRATSSGRIYVRMILPGQTAIAQELGAERVWNRTLHKCLTSVQMIIAAAPKIAGSCTQVGYVADNPGYNANAAIAAPLRKVVAQAGPACLGQASDRRLGCGLRRRP